MDKTCIALIAAPIFLFIIFHYGCRARNNLRDIAEDYRHHNDPR